MTSTEIEISNWFDTIIRDEKYFTARYAKTLSRIFNIEVDLLVKIVAIVFLTTLVVSKEAHYLANFVLIAYPIIVTFIHPQEKPPTRWLLIHWLLFGFSVLFDRLLQFIPFYFAIKVVLFTALYLPPSNRVIVKIEDGLMRIRVGA